MRGIQRASQASAHEMQPPWASFVVFGSHERERRQRAGAQIAREGSCGGRPQRELALETLRREAGEVGSCRVPGNVEPIPRVRAAAVGGHRLGVDAPRSGGLREDRLRSRDAATRRLAVAADDGRRHGARGDRHVVGQARVRLGMHVRSLAARLRNRPSGTERAHHLVVGLVLLDDHDHVLVVRRGGGSDARRGRCGSGGARG